MKHREVASQISNPRSGMKRDIKYTSLQVDQKNDQVFSAKRMKLQSFVPATRDHRLGTDIQFFDNVLKISGEKVMFNVSTTGTKTFSYLKLVYKSWDSNLCCLKCDSNHSLISKGENLYVFISDEHSPAIITSLGSSQECVANIRVSGATLDELGEIMFRNISYGNKGGLVMGSLDALITVANNSNMDVHLGLTSGTSFLEGCAGTVLQDMHNIVKRVTMSGDKKFQLNPLNAVKTIQFFSPLTPHIPPPMNSSSGAPAPAKELQYLDWEANNTMLKLTEVSTFHSGQFNQEKELFRVSCANQRTDPLLFSSFSRTETGKSLAKVFKFVSSRHMHGNFRISVPMTLARLEGDEGLCTSAERGTKALSLQSIAAYCKQIQSDLLHAAGKGVAAEFCDYFQARAPMMNIHAKSTTWATQTRFPAGGMGLGICANSSKHNTVVKFANEEEMNAHLRNCN